MTADARGPAEAVLSVRNLVKHFPVRGRGLLHHRVGDVHAVCDVSFDLYPHETLGLVGESGCGKTTTARVLLTLQVATAGHVHYQGTELTQLPRKAMQRLRRELQIVFQDPYAALDPRLPVNEIIAEPLRIHGLYGGLDGHEKVRELLALVGLKPEHGNRFPHEFSGGQRQRIGIARALALRPKVLVLDEPVSALDVSIQAQILNLLRRLQRERGITMVFIAHDCSVVRHMCDRVAVMYLGKVVELADADTLYAAPKHPYTGALLSAVPVPDPRLHGSDRRLLSGDIPSPANPPRACRFHTRCPKAQDLCSREDPPLQDKGTGTVAACHFPLSREELEQMGVRSVDVGNRD